MGDNLFHGQGLVPDWLKQQPIKRGDCICIPRQDPNRDGVVEFDKSGRVLSLEEKPTEPKSRYAVTGLYFYDSSVVELAKRVQPSARGELEITDLNKFYLEKELLQVELMGRGMAWLDTGTYDSLNDAASYIRTLEQRQGLKVGCPEEVAWRQGWIDSSKLESLASLQRKSGYGKYLLQILNENSSDHLMLQSHLEMTTRLTS